DMATALADESGRPAQRLQVVQAVVISAEPRLELAHRPRGSANPRVDDPRGQATPVKWIPPIAGFGICCDDEVAEFNIGDLQELLQTYVPLRAVRPCGQRRLQLAGAAWRAAGVSELGQPAVLGWQAAVGVGRLRRVGACGFRVLRPDS